MNNPNLMDVEIDGKIERRPIDHVVLHKSRSVGISELQLHSSRVKHVPVLRDGEDLVWTLGSEIPIIIRKRG
ncbi:hypothetical protein [Cupriavidus basilensis]|uniref:hypothetical protein n=1 Tax=Cupriavidus basilensis TaxID=68895 RepID=UPI0020A69BE5|nr:hypothetical protein [Cupriavidus basilensis]MCP3017429.1 hypothetical protein [Cupriavidus basilensis]